MELDLDTQWLIFQIISRWELNQSINVLMKLTIRNKLLI
jgi:hypothetical protein